MKTSPGKVLEFCFPISVRTLSTIAKCGNCVYNWRLEKEFIHKNVNPDQIATLWNSMILHL